MKAYAFCLLLSITLDFPSAADGLGQAVQCYEHGQFHKAVDLLSQLSQASPGDPEVRLWYGKALLKVGKWDDAVRQVEKAVERERTNAVHYLWLGRACGGRASHSNLFTAPGWAKRVLKAFKTAEELDPCNLDVRFDLMDYYLNAPGFLGGGHDKAEAEAAAIAKLNPSAGYTARALIFEKDKNWDQALTSWEDAATAFPSDADAFVDLADFQLRRNDFGGAETNARKALSLKPGLPRAKLIIAAADTRLGKDLEQAENTLKNLAEGPLTDNDPTFEEVLYWLGECYLAKGNRQEAQGAFSASLRYNPDYDKAKSALSRLR